MPFKTNQELAEKVKGTDKLSDRKKSQFMAVFNKCWDEKGDDSSCYAMAWGAVKNTSSMRMVAGELHLIAQEVEFSFKRLERQMWRDAVKEAQERQGIFFDLENDDSEDDPKIVKVGEYEIGDEKKPYRFIVQLCQAGGDWQNPIYYYRIQLKDGYLRTELMKSNTDNHFVFIPVNGNNNLTIDGKKMGPTEDNDGVKSVKPDEKALKDDLIHFLEKLIEASEKTEWEEPVEIKFKDGKIASGITYLGHAKSEMGDGWIRFQIGNAIWKYDMLGNAAETAYRMTRYSMGRALVWTKRHALKETRERAGNSRKMRHAMIDFRLNEILQEKFAPEKEQVK